VGPGDVLGEVTEGGLRHSIMVPPGMEAGVLRELDAGAYTARDEIGTLDGPSGPLPLRLAHPWPLRSARPAARRLSLSRPLVTGQRVIDMLYPVALGGTAVVPGAFGTGKTVVEQQLARWSDADVVVYVGCGERGNEMAELLSTFPELDDPRTGAPLLERTVLVANTSNMPVAAREASVQLGMTVAEYFRDQGLHVALLADSTSRWAEALREISGRLEELPGEEGFPAYLGSRLASFYERTGQVDALGAPARTGSVTLVAAVSPPGGDFSEPVTQASLRLAGTFWALDAELAHARHFPAIGWDRSYSLYVDSLTSWYADTLGLDWSGLRASALELLAREKELLDIVALVGADALPEHDRGLLEVARLVRESFLQQGAFDPVDSARPLDEQLALLDAVLASQAYLERVLDSGETISLALESELIAELRRAKELSGPDVVSTLAALAARLRGDEAEGADGAAAGDEQHADESASGDAGDGRDEAPAEPALAAAEPAGGGDGSAPDDAPPRDGPDAEAGKQIATDTRLNGREPSDGSESAPVVRALSAHRLTGADRLVGPLLVLRRTPRMALGEDVSVRAADGTLRHGQIAELDKDMAVIQVYEGTAGLDVETVQVELSGDTFRLGVSSAMLGRVLDGRGLPIDEGPPIVPLQLADVNGRAINPASRDHPEDFIETGITAIDLMASLVCGQKLPIFTGSGLPANELAARIATGARLLGEERFVTVFAAMGITRREADGFRDAFASSGVLDSIAVFLNLADDPAIERLLTPRCALTLAEHLGFELGFNVLVVMTDVLAYGEALRELSTAREEIPGRRGYPGYLYTDLATLFERAGRVRGKPGSVTVLPIVTLPDDDITHPIPDLTGYITEGQIVLSRELWGRSIAPPVDVLPCLSRVMNAGIGEGRTRPEHRVIADQLYALYARGRSLRQLVTVIGEAALSDGERRVLGFADAFEHRLVSQGRERRTLDDSFDVAWAILDELPDEELTRIPTAVLDRLRASLARGAATGVDAGAQTSPAP
jgi:V/A-type H+-transporting ATPase subunit B